MQAPLSEVTPELLAERRPIVVDERLVDPAGFAASAAFRWQHVWRSAEPEACRLDAFASTSPARFTLLFFDSTESSQPTIVIKTALSGDDGEAVAVRLAPGRVLIMPPGWRYLPLAAGARRVRMHDAFTYFLWAPS